MELTLQIKDVNEGWKILNRRSIKGLTNEERFVVLSELLQAKTEWETSGAFAGGAQYRVKTVGD
jgi:hypothetical protein